MLKQNHATVVVLAAFLVAAVVWWLARDQDDSATNLRATTQILKAWTLKTQYMEP